MSGELLLSFDCAAASGCVTTSTGCALETVEVSLFLTGRLCIWLSVVAEVVTVLCGSGSFNGLMEPLETSNWVGLYP